MGNHRDSVIDGLTQIAESLGRGGGGVRDNGTLNSTINVEPRMPWPEFGDKNKNPEEADNFIRQFEGICRMANNGAGMRSEDMVHTLGNCLKGNRKILYDTSFKTPLRTAASCRTPLKFTRRSKGDS